MSETTATNGAGGNSKLRIVFDIETGPLPADQLQSLIDPFPDFVAPGPFDPASVKTGNIKDPAKKAEKIEAARAEHEKAAAGATVTYETERAAHHDLQVSQAALSPVTGRVLAIGYLAVKPGGNPDFYINGDADEQSILRDFWQQFQLAQDGRMIGFNITGFDVPFLIRRSWILNVPLPTGLIDKGRWLSPVFVDLMGLWQLGDRSDRISLDRLCKVLGLGEKNGSGADFAKLWETDRPAALEYLRNDIRLTAKAAKRLGVL